MNGSFIENEKEQGHIHTNEKFHLDARNNLNF